ncbi:hypothetical protein ABTN43_20110, partial [Acinetobacter baumannii]
IDGTAISTSEQATASIRSHTPGQVVSLDVERPRSPNPDPSTTLAPRTLPPSDPVHVEVTTVACGSRCPGEENRALVGIT